MLGAMLGGLAFSNASVALVHGMSRPIGAHFHVPHGLSNAMLLPAVTRFSVGHAPERYAAAARQIGLAGAADDDDAGLRPAGRRAGGAECRIGCPESARLWYRRRRRGRHAWTSWQSRRSPPAVRPTTRGCPSKDEIVALYRAVYSANS